MLNNGRFCGGSGNNESSREFRARSVESKVMTILVAAGRPPEDMKNGKRFLWSNGVFHPIINVKALSMSRFAWLIPVCAIG